MATPSDLAPERQRVDAAAEDGGDRCRDDVAVLLGGDADQVGDGGIGAEDVGDALVGDQLPELGRLMSNST
jgi:hypothetical protein